MATIVYVLTNPAMPGMVKIGKTDRDPQTRMKELYSTGVPNPFECAFAAEFDGDISRLEKALHTAFGPYRDNPSREFFKIDSYQAEAILRIWPGAKDVTPKVRKEMCPVDPPGRKAMRRPNYNFSKMGIPVRSILVSVHTDEEATVVSGNRVSFRGEEMPLGEATKMAWDVDYIIAPMPRWTFDGRSLRDIYNETYGGRGE